MNMRMNRDTSYSLPVMKSEHKHLLGIRDKYGGVVVPMAPIVRGRRIEDLNLPYADYAVIDKAGVRYIGELEAMSPWQWRLLHCMGSARCEKVLMALCRYHGAPYRPEYFRFKSPVVEGIERARDVFNTNTCQTIY